MVNLFRLEVLLPLAQLKSPGGNVDEILSCCKDCITYAICVRRSLLDNLYNCSILRSNVKPMLTDEDIEQLPVKLFELMFTDEEEKAVILYKAFNGGEDPEVEINGVGVKLKIEYIPVIEKGD